MRRIESLDGLRGIAALTVLIHHGLLLFPALAEPHYTGEPTKAGTAAWLLTHTPLHMLWEGKAGVYVFFVLSGFVLTLPALRPQGYTWRSYYPSRLIRLYLPAWGAVLFAIGTFFIVPRTTDVSSLWLDERPREVTTTAVTHDLTLIAGTGGLASPLWSLQWEILFSLALPVVIWAALRLRKAHATLVIVGIAATAVGGAIGETMLIYPPMFLLGVILALRREEVARVVSRFGRVAWISGLLVSSVAVSSLWLMMGVGAPAPVFGAMRGVMLVGACAFVILALEWGAARRLLGIPALRRLGELSFSLYLVHEPIIVAAGFALPANPVLALGIAAALTVVVTPVFYWAVEQPSHLLARLVARRVSRKAPVVAVGS